MEADQGRGRGRDDLTILAPFGGRTPRRLAGGLRLAQAPPVTQRLRHARVLVRTGSSSSPSRRTSRVACSRHCL